MKIVNNCVPKRSSVLVERLPLRPQYLPTMTNSGYGQLQSHE